MDVIILAGGLGTRLRSVVKDVPKCMAPVAGKPFLWYLLHQLSNYNVGKVVLSVGYLREVIMEWIDKGEYRWPFDIDYAIEEEPLGTGGGIRLATKKCESDDILILNGDTFFNIDLSAMLSTHRKNGKTMTIGLKPMKNFSRYGNVRTENGVVKEFKEKEPCKEGDINGGVYIISKKKLNMDNLPQKFSFETEVLQPLAAKDEIQAQVSSEYFIDIGIPEDYETADNTFGKMFTPIDQLDLSKYDTILVDRDGTLNTHILDGYVTKPCELTMLQNTETAIAKWKSEGKTVIIITNQRGVGKGVMTQADLQAVHESLKEKVEKRGGKIDAIYTSTGLDSSDKTRKPNTGMMDMVMRDFPQTRKEKTVMIGDGETDMQFAENAGIDGIRIY